MVPKLLRASAALTLVVSFATAPAFADPSGVFGNAVSGANAAIKNAENAKPAAKPAASQAVAQVPPVQQQPIGPQAVGLPTGVTYMLDASMAYPFGNIGTLGKRWLHGGMDGVLGYGFTPTVRLVANYYEIQHYPVGFNSGQVGLYLPPGFPPSPGVNPSCVDLSGTATPTCAGINPQLNLTTKDKFGLGLLEKLITVGSFKGRPIPIVLTPTYVSRWSDIAASNGNGDVVPFVTEDGRVFTNVNTRTTQDYAVAVTLPLLHTPKMFGTFTVAPTWLVHPAGANLTNHMQPYQILYLEYTPLKDTKIFFEPQESRDYLPEDTYPEHNFVYFLGASQTFAKMFFVQLVLNSGGPSNISPYGVKQLNCLALPCSANTVPMVGGLHATQLQFQVGIGSPSVIQF